MKTMYGKFHLNKMKKIIPVIILVCVSLNAQTIGSIHDFSAVSARLRMAVDNGELPGVGLIIVNCDSTLYKEAFGANTVNSTFLIASATKLASATLMMALVDEGLIALDDPIAKYLPQFEDAKGNITIRQLLSQTHGLPANHPAIPLPGRDNGLTLEQAVDQIAHDVIPIRPPTTAFEYAPAVSYHIMGRIAEVITGEPWAVLFKKIIVDPLQMPNTSYGNTQNPRIGGGISTTLDDYSHLLQMHLCGGTFGTKRVLSDSAIVEMQKDHVKGLPFLSSPQKPEIGYGLTWWFDKIDTNRNASQISVPGAYGAIPWINFSYQYGAFLLTFDQLENSVPVWEEIVPLIHQTLDMVTGIKDQLANPPESFRLNQNYPNPFNPSTTINFSLPKTGYVTLKVFDILGREASTLVDSKMTAGKHSVLFNAMDLPSSIYFYQLNAGDFMETKKMILVK
ncbi:MAG: serine hydrolase [Bacteroidetes bacterium]|nr:serine hydrolase [Bacteroidota bacterium]